MTMKIVIYIGPINVYLVIYVKVKCDRLITFSEPVSIFCTFCVAEVPSLL